MPRRKPDTVKTVRFELGTKERQIAGDAVLASALPAVGIGLAGVAVGAGLWFGLLFVNNTLDDVTQWVKDTWAGENWQYRKDALQEVEDSIAQPMTALSLGRGSVRTWEEGLSPYAAYEQASEQINDCMRMNYAAWIEYHDLNVVDNAALEYFTSFTVARRRSGADEDDDLVPLSKCLRNCYTQRPLSNVINEGEDQSYFGYQMTIRETAARRLQSIGVGSLNLAGFLLPTNWTSTDVREAPGYVEDPLLDIAWARIDFKGPDAHVGAMQMIDTWYITRGYELAAYARDWTLMDPMKQTDPQAWPPLYLTGWNSNWSKDTEADPTFIGPPSSLATP